MQTASRIIALGGVFLLTEGCHRVVPPTTPPSVESFESSSDFVRLICNRGSITFRSWNGQALRIDGDTELTFYPDQTVHMFEWGYSLSSYRGTYRVCGDCLVLCFTDFGWQWPAMVCYRENSALLLRPRDSAVDFVMGNRGGATMPRDKGSYWPFRMLTGDAERKVLNMIKEHSERPQT